MKRRYTWIALSLFALATMLWSVSSARAQGEPAIDLEKTVGTVPGTCAVTDPITVDAGTEVTYCYRVTNTGDVQISNITVVDDKLGIIVANDTTIVAPGSSIFYLESTVIEETTTNVAVATVDAAYIRPVEDTDTATVFVEGATPTPTATSTTVPTATATATGTTVPTATATATGTTVPTATATATGTTVPTAHGNRHDGPDRYRNGNRHDGPDRHRNGNGHDGPDRNGDGYCHSHAHAYGDGHRDGACYQHQG